MGYRPDMFTHVVNTLRNGMTQDELSKKLSECVIESCKSGKVSKLTLTLTIKPNGDTGVYNLKEVIKQDLPSPEKGETIMFGTPDGNLSRQAPNQGKLDLKDVTEPASSYKDVDNKEGTA